LSLCIHREGINLSDLPFQANVSDIELTISVSLQPRVTLGIELFEVAHAVSRLFIDLPKTPIVLTQVATTAFNANCEPLGIASSDTDDIDLLQVLFQNLTHITIGYEVGVGLDFTAGMNFALDLGVVGVKNLNIEATTSLPLLSTQLDRLAATQCLVFQPDATGRPAFAKATKALADAQSSVAAAAAASSSSAQAASSASAAATTASSGSRRENAACSTHMAAVGTWVWRSVVFTAGWYLGL